MFFVNFMLYVLTFSMNLLIWWQSWRNKQSLSFYRILSQRSKWKQETCQIDPATFLFPLDCEMWWIVTERTEKPSDIMETSSRSLRYVQAFVFQTFQIVSPVLTFVFHENTIETSLTWNKCHLAKFCKVDA